MSTALQTALPTGTWGTDKTHSTANFAIKYMVSTFRSEFTDVDVQLDTTGDEPKLTGSVDPASIQVKDENFHAHLQSPEFFDTENHPQITFESTGFRVDGEDLVVDGNLTIKGETRQETDSKERNFHRLERRFGSFQRTIGLPTTVKADAIQASLTNGVLRLEIPKAEEVKPRKISVNVGENKTLEVAKNN